MWLLSQLPPSFYSYISQSSEVTNQIIGPLFVKGQFNHHSIHFILTILCAQV